MSPDDTDSDGSEHSNGESTVDGGGRESQPRDPETGQFLPKDERAETETTGSGGTASTAGESGSGELGDGPSGPADRATGSAGRETGVPGDDRPTATRPRGQRPREPPEQHRQQASPMRLYTLPPTHPLVRSTAGPAPTEAAGGRDLPLALDLVVLQVQRDGRPVLWHAPETTSHSEPTRPVPNPQTRQPTAAVEQSPPTGTDHQRDPKTRPQRAPPADARQFSESTPPHPPTGAAESVPTAAWSHTTPPTDGGPQAGSGPSRPPGSARGQEERSDRSQ